MPKHRIINMNADTYYQVLMQEREQQRYEEEVEAEVQRLTREERYWDTDYELQSLLAENVRLDIEKLKLEKENLKLANEKLRLEIEQLQDSMISFSVVEKK